MILMLAGVVVFFGVHSLRVLAGPWRQRQVDAMGPTPWKIVYSLASAAGLALLVWGYSMARVGSPMLWSPPPVLRWVTAPLVLVAFVLFACAYVPGTRIKSAIGHPLTAGVKTWAVAHLVSNGSLADIVLFGSFMVWSIAVFAVARRRDRAAGIRLPPGRVSRDAIALAIGTAAWVAFAWRGHQWLTGASPFA